MASKNPAQKLLDKLDGQWFGDDALDMLWQAKHHGIAGDWDDRYDGEKAAYRFLKRNKLIRPDPARDTWMSATDLGAALLSAADYD